MNTEMTTKERILVVEDDKDFAALIESVLARQGYDVTVANDCDEGLERFQEQTPDLVTLDLQMPKGKRKSGLHFYRKVKSCDANANIPIVIVTGVISVMLLWRHRSNIRNLMAGTEGKIR